MPSEFILTAQGDRAAQVATVDRFLRALSPKRAWAVRISQYRLTRSDRQNNYLQGVAYRMLSDATGYERDDIAEFLCGTYFGWKQVKCPKTPDNPKGVKSVPVRTTTVNELGEYDVLATEPFGKYVEFVQRFAAGHGVLIPDPDPYFKERK